MNHSSPKIPWSVEGFARFWAKPGDVGRAAAVVTEDVVGHWPGRREPVRGIPEYIAALAKLIALVPDLRLEVAEHAANGDFVFIRWIMQRHRSNGCVRADGNRSDANARRAPRREHHPLRQR